MDLSSALSAQKHKRRAASKTKLSVCPESGGAHTESGSPNREESSATLGNPNPNLRDRFEREARTVSSLNHPNICILHDIGHQNGIDFLVLEYIEGETLAERLSKGPLPLELVLRYAQQIAGALEKAHRHGIVHRDLKPGNIMITRTGAKILDFGLAKAFTPSPQSLASSLSILQTEEAKNLTAEGTIIGLFSTCRPSNWKEMKRTHDPIFFLLEL